MLDITKLTFNRMGVHWFLDTLKHRDNDLPAVEHFDGSKFWYQHGLRHRINGPAIIDKDGSSSYWLNHQLVTEDQWRNDVFTSI